MGRNDKGTLSVFIQERRRNMLRKWQDILEKSRLFNNKQYIHTKLGVIQKGLYNSLL